MPRTLPLAPLFAALLLTACPGEDVTPDPSDPPTATPTATSITTTPTPTQPPGPTPTVQPPTPTATGATPTPTASTPTVPPTPTQTPTATGTPALDKDGDGYQIDEDCNDLVATIYPGAEEACDGLDQDCDTAIDEGVPTLSYYADDDGDGYGDPSAPIESCNAIPGLVSNGDDCDDTDPSLNPDTAWFPDDDGDGYGESILEVNQCEGPMGYTQQGGDCADDDSDRNPGAAETCDGIDEDCDGAIDNDSPCYDDDGDGFCEEDCVDGSTAGDCDDRDPFTYPDAPERFDWKDNSCDGSPETGRIFPIDLAQIQLGGSLQGSFFGRGLAGGGNFNGDKTSEGRDLDDLIIGSPYEDLAAQEKGSVYIVRGRELGWPSSFTLIQDVEDVTRLDGIVSTGHFGETVHVVGDMNGDGLDDLCLAAPNAAVAQASVANAGSAYVVLGRVGELAEGPISAVVSTRVDGTSTNVELGSSLSGGDIDGDRLADLIIGAPDQSDSAIWQNSGWAFVLRGQSSAYPAVIGPNGVEKLRGAPEEGLGQAVTFLGNFRGGTNRDFALGGKGDASKRGLAQIVSGQAQYQGVVSTSTLEVSRYTGIDIGEELGQYLAGDVDINGDDLSDLLIGRRFREAADQGTGARVDGVAYAIFGATGLGSDAGTAESLADVRFIYPYDVDPCPCAVTKIGDMDGDGLGDIAISATLAGPTDNPAARDGTGRIWIIYGRETWEADFDLEASADAILEGTIAGGRLGFTLAGAGDLNGDGYDELVIAAPYAPLDTGAEAPLGNVGRVYVQLGAPRSDGAGR